MEMRTPFPAHSRFKRVRISDIWEWSVEESDVSETSSYPVSASPSSTEATMLSAVRSRTGRYIMPAWQKRQPRAHPRRISTFKRSCTASVNGTMHGSHAGLSANPRNTCFSMNVGRPSSKGSIHEPASCASSASRQRYSDGTYHPSSAASARHISRRDAPRARWVRMTSSPSGSDSSPSPMFMASKNGAYGSGLSAHGPPATTSGSSSARSTA